MVAITECFTASRNGARHVAQIFPSLSRFRPGDPAWPHRNATVLVALVAGRRKLKSPAFTAVRAELQRQCDGHRDCRHLELGDKGGCKRDHQRRRDPVHISQALPPPAERHPTRRALGQPGIPGSPPLAP